MKTCLFQFIVCTLLVNSAQAQNESRSEQIFIKTIQTCYTGTVSSALKIGFDPKIILGGFVSFSKALSLESSEINRRVENFGLSSELAELRSSEAFWQALAVCYGYNGELNYGLFIKQVIDLGHLVSEATGTSLGLLGILKSTKWIEIFNRQYPLAFKFILNGIISIKSSQLLNLIYEENKPLSPEEVQKLAIIQKNLFAEPNQAIDLILQMGKKRLIEIQLELENQNFSLEEKKLLLNKKSSLENAILELEQKRQIQK